MMQKSMIIFMVLGISLVHVPNSFGMERSRQPSWGEQASFSTLEAEKDALMEGLRKCKEEKDGLVLLCKESEATKNKLVDTNRKYFYSMVAAWTIIAVVAISSLVSKRKRLDGMGQDGSIF